MIRTRLAARVARPALAVVLLVAISLVAAAAALLAAPGAWAAATPVTMVAVDFERGFVPDTGAVYSLTSPEDAVLGGGPSNVRSVPGEGLAFGIYLPSQTVFWSFEFAAPVGDLLVAGHYESGVSADEPGPYLEFSGTPGCIAESRSFDVAEISIDAEGNPLSFAASFSQRCGQFGTIQGEIRFNSTVPIAAYAVGAIYLDLPMTEVGSTSSAVPLTIRNTGTVDLNVRSTLDTDDFVISADGCAGSAVPPGETCIVDVAMAPTGSGPRSGWLDLATNTMSGGHRVLLRGPGHGNTTTTLTTSRDPSIYKTDPATITATIDPPTSTGWVDFKPDGGSVATKYVSHGTATITSNFSTDRTWTATYRGDTYNASSTSETLIQHAIPQGTVHLWASAVTAPVGYPVLVGAETLSPPAGTVLTVVDQSTGVTLGSGPTDDPAIFGCFSRLSPGVHHLRAWTTGPLPFEVTLDLSIGSGIVTPAPTTLLAAIPAGMVCADIALRDARPGDPVRLPTTVADVPIRAAGPRPFTHVRLSNVADLEADGGLLAKGVSYDYGARAPWSFLDPTTGGLPGIGPRDLWYQLQDDQGVWTSPAAFEVDVYDGPSDLTPPIGGMQVVDWHYRAQVFDLALTFADPESGIDHVDVHCDNLPSVTYPSASLLKIPYFDPSRGGCETNGWHWITVTAYNGAGLSASGTDDVPLGYAVQLVVSDQPTTGEPITFTPEVPAAFETSPGDDCEWEVRWGNDAAILDNDFNSTFGSLLVAGRRSKGFCDAWTFTLPYAPVPHFQVSFRLETPDEGVLSDSIGFKRDGTDIIRAAVGSMERRITSSTMPVMMVLPDAYIATVGEPITYRLYPAGGAEFDDNDSWVAGFQAGEHAFTKAGGRSFTFTPDRVGDWAVFWNASGSEPYLLGAGYDPPAKRADRTRPSTTTPVIKVGSGHVGSTVPGAVSWHGSDVGWGIDHYMVQRSVDGGAWGGARRLKGTSTTVSLTPGHTYRFRVRAVDKAGNKGTWDEGPKVRVRALQETSGSLTWKGAWSVVDEPEAWAGHSRQATAGGASVVYAFTGRAIAWVAGRDAVRGKAKVYLDGDLVATVDLATASADPRRIIWRRGWSSSGAHKIRIEVVGNGGAIVDVDGFLVLR